MKDTSILVSILVALIAGGSASVIAPWCTSWMSRRNWRKQRNFELKYEAFRGACGALASFFTDAHNITLQNEKPTYQRGVHHVEHHVEITPETSQALEQYRGLIEAFFSDEVFKKYDQATRAVVSIENTPNIEFEEKRLAFIKAAALELKLNRA
jgi:hypothetical protein